ncbi:MAG: winged helix-turn-helix transcriptional regulator [Fimbriimonadaceae bacterium]
MTLVHDCGATHRGVQLSLDFLIAQGFVDKNPGYGHPLRPEIILNERLLVIESNLADLFSPKQWKGQVGKNVWDFALLQSMTEYNGRFTEIRDSLPGITDRALSPGLKALESDGLVWRSITANATAAADLFPFRNPARCWLVGLSGLLKRWATPKCDP